MPISRLQYESNNKKSDAGGSSSSNMSRLPIIRSLAEIGRIHSSNKSKLTCWVTQNLFVHFPKRDTLSYRILENRAKLIILFDDFIDRKAIIKSRLGNVRNVNKPARWCATLMHWEQNFDKLPFDLNSRQLPKQPKFKFAIFF